MTISRKSLFVFLLPLVGAGVAQAQEPSDPDRPVVELSAPEPMLQQVIASRLGTAPPALELVGACGASTSDGSFCVENSTLRDIKLTLLLGESTLIPIELQSGGKARASIASAGKVQDATLVALTQKGEGIVVRRQKVEAGRSYVVFYNDTEKLFELRSAP